MATRKVTAKVRDEILKRLVKNFGPGYDNKGVVKEQLEAIPTGHDDLDSLLTLGARGIAKGCIVELFGGEGSGKSSLALRVVGNAQKAGDLCCWFDAEAAFSYNLATINGVDCEHLIMPDLANTKIRKKGKKGKEEEIEEDELDLPMEESDPNKPISLFNSREVLEMIYKSVVANIYGVVVLDSVAGLMPERILAEDFDPNKAGMAEVARSMSEMLGKIAQACQKTETTVIFINQLRDKPGEYFQNRFHTPGGRALKFFAHQRINVEKIMGKSGPVFGLDEDGEEQLLGHYARCTIVKNKMAPPVPPDLSIEIPIYYVHYDPDDAKLCYDLARKLQVISIRKGVLSWKREEDENIKIAGESSMLEKIREDKLESQLAAYCVEASQSEKNKKKKIRIPSSVTELAQSYTPQEKPKKKKKAKPKDPDPCVDLD